MHRARRRLTGALLVACVAMAGGPAFGHSKGPAVILNDHRIVERGAEWDFHASVVLMYDGRKTMRLRCRVIQPFADAAGRILAKRSARFRAVVHGGPTDELRMTTRRFVIQDVEPNWYPHPIDVRHCHRRR